MWNSLFSVRRVVAVMSLALAAGVSAAAQQQGGPATAVPGTAAAAYRNIQVLKEIPATQFIPTMRFISTALGVECEFCHAGDRSVDNEHKNTARKMITMMMGINKASFSGRTNVTCYTCHHGASDPSTTPTPTGEYSALGATAFFSPNGGPIANRDVVMSDAYKAYTAKDPLAGMPTPDQILTRYVNALGGEQALRKVTARTITAAAELAADVRGAGPAVHATLQWYSKAPNQWMMTYQMSTGSTSNGFDGNVAWIQAANGGVTEATAAANSALPPLARVKRNADFYQPLNLKQEYPRLTLLGIEKVRDRDAYVLLGFPQGDSPERLFFDKETGLLLRKLTVVATPLGDYPYQTDYDDYRDIGGVKIPFMIKTVSISPADDLTIRVEKVENNPAIDAARFAKPASRPPAAR